MSSTIIYPARAYLIIYAGTEVKQDESDTKTEQYAGVKMSNKDGLISYFYVCTHGYKFELGLQGDELRNGIP